MRETEGKGFFSSLFSLLLSHEPLSGRCPLPKAPNVRGRVRYTQALLSPPTL